MTPTIVVLRVDGHGTEHLTLHADRARAERRLLDVYRDAWSERFGYSPPELPAPLASDRLVAEGWRVRIEETEVEL